MLAGGLASRPGHSEGRRLGGQKAAAAAPGARPRWADRQAGPGLPRAGSAQPGAAACERSVPGCRRPPDPSVSQTRKRSPAGRRFTSSLWARHCHSSALLCSLSRRPSQTPWRLCLAPRERAALLTPVLGAHPPAPTPNSRPPLLPLFPPTLCGPRPRAALPVGAGRPDSRAGEAVPFHRASRAETQAQLITRPASVFTNVSSAPTKSEPASQGSRTRSTLTLETVITKRRWGVRGPEGTQGLPSRVSTGADTLLCTRRFHPVRRRLKLRAHSRDPTLPAPDPCVPVSWVPQLSPDPEPPAPPTFPVAHYRRPGSRTFGTFQNLSPLPTPRSSLPGPCPSG